MKIGTLFIKGKTFLAPLAGISNLPFRMLVKNIGCAVVCSEMISAKGLYYQSKRTLDLLDSNKKEKPLSVQLFGSEPESMAKAAKIVQESKCADIIDINFGCSIKKIIKQKAGVALMKEPQLAKEIISSVRSSIDLPLTIKIRSGWDHFGTQAFKIATIAQDKGVNAIILHPRTAAQKFKGQADWNLIKKLKQQIDIPVIGNGDIKSAEDAIQMIEFTKCDGVMVGRAAMHNPFILSQIESFLKTSKYETISNSKILKAMEDLTQMYIDYYLEESACRKLRGRLAWFIKGLPGAVAFRQKLSKISSKENVFSLIQNFKKTIS